MGQMIYIVSFYISTTAFEYHVSTVLRYGFQQFELEHHISRSQGLRSIRKQVRRRKTTKSNSTPEITAATDHTSRTDNSTRPPETTEKNRSDQQKRRQGPRITTPNPSTPEHQPKASSPQLHPTSYRISPFPLHSPPETVPHPHYPHPFPSPSTPSLVH